MIESMANVCLKTELVEHCAGVDKGDIYGRLALPVREPHPEGDQSDLPDTSCCRRDYAPSVQTRRGQQPLLIFLAPH